MELLIDKFSSMPLLVATFYCADKVVADWTLCTSSAEIVVFVTYC